MSGSSNNSASTSKTPSHIAYHVRDTKTGAFWTRIGCAWLHADGEGLNVLIDAIPLDGRISLCVNSGKEK